MALHLDSCLPLARVARDKIFHTSSTTAFSPYDVVPCVCCVHRKHVSIINVKRSMICRISGGAFLKRADSCFRPDHSRPGPRVERALHESEAHSQSWSSLSGLRIVPLFPVYGDVSCLSVASIYTSTALLELNLDLFVGEGRLRHYHNVDAAPESLSKNPECRVCAFMSSIQQYSGRHYYHRVPLRFVIPPVSRVVASHHATRRAFGATPLRA